LRSLAPFPIDRLHIIGGGSLNALLNQMTADATGVTVVAGPCEATALGNVMLQAKALGVVGSLQEMRDIIRRSETPTVYTPTNTQAWEKQYGRFLKITG